MSRAFVSEDAADATAAILPERPVSPAPNLVTQSGLDRIEAEVARLQALLAAADPNAPERPAHARDLRYWRARQASAQLVPATEDRPAEVAFGTRVTVRRGGATTAYIIVGEDEANPAAGLLGWTSPVARALLGARPGEVVEVGGGRPALLVEGIERG